MQCEKRTITFDCTPVPSIYPKPKSYSLTWQVCCSGGSDHTILKALCSLWLCVGGTLDAQVTKQQQQQCHLQLFSGKFKNAGIYHDRHTLKENSFLKKKITSTCIDLYQQIESESTNKFSSH